MERFWCGCIESLRIGAAQRGHALYLGLDRPYRAGRSPHWIKVKEPRAPRYEARDGFFLMQVYCAKNCETIVEAEIIDLGAGAGRIRCLECGGDGDWSRFAPDMMPPGMICLDCKGSGYQLVSI